MRNLSLLSPTERCPQLLDMEDVRSYNNFLVSVQEVCPKSVWARPKMAASVSLAHSLTQPVLQ